MTNALFRLIRIEKRLSQREFAELLGVSKTLVSLIERNERKVTKTTENKVITAFKISEDDMERLTKLQAELRGVSA